MIERLEKPGRTEFDNSSLRISSNKYDISYTVWRSFQLDYESYVSYVYEEYWLILHLTCSPRAGSLKSEEHATRRRDHMCKLLIILPNDNGRDGFRVEK
jgi:hypothetical protein